MNQIFPALRLFLFHIHRYPTNSNRFGPISQQQQNSPGKPNDYPPNFGGGGFGGPGAQGFAGNPQFGQGSKNSVD